LSVSANGNDWHPIENSTERSGSYVTFTIPQNCLDAGTLSLRMTECAVSGFALTA
jgi:hypothetical protein